MRWTLAFYAQADNKSPVEEFLNSLSIKEQAKCLYYLLLLEQQGNTLPSQYAKHIEDDLWELRPEFGGVEMRYFYFTWIDQMIVVVHAAKKKSQKLPKREIKLAQKRAKEVKDGKINPFNSLLNEKLNDPEFADEFRKSKNEVDFGLSLIQAREYRNMTQTQLAEQTAIRQETLSRIERGRLPDFKTVLKIAKILNVRVVVWPDGRTLLEPAEQDQIAA